MGANGSIGQSANHPCLDYQADWSPDGRIVV
jgi:hypothetical protein